MDFWGDAANAAQRIADEREKRSWSQAKLADLMTDRSPDGYRISESKLSRIEKGTTKSVGVDEIVAAARAMQEADK